MLGISWTAKKSNETKVNEVNTRSLMNRLRKRQAILSRHVMIREKLGPLRTFGMVEGKRSRGKQSEEILAQVDRNTKSDMGEGCVEGRDHLR